MDELSELARWAYIGACVGAPAVWGAACAWVFTRRDEKRDREAELERRPPVDYVI